MKNLLILLCLVTLALGAAVRAHEGREVGAYDIEFGWRVEPAYVGVYNGPEVFVHDRATGDPVPGLESTLHLMVRFGDQEKGLELYRVWNDPGHYTADLIPTRAGDYSFHLSGQIGAQCVDEHFTSADGKFGSVEPATDVLFPMVEDAGAPEAGDIAALQAQMDALRAELEALKAATSP